MRTVHLVPIIALYACNYSLPIPVTADLASSPATSDLAAPDLTASGPAMLDLAPQACLDGEFPCPGGHFCDQARSACGTRMDGSPIGCCVLDFCVQRSCPPGTRCQHDAMGNAACIDACMNVICPPTATCVDGQCEDCRTLGCPPGEQCAGSPPACVDDP